MSERREELSFDDFEDAYSEYSPRKQRKTDLSPPDKRRAPIPYRLLARISRQRGSRCSEELVRYAGRGSAGRWHNGPNHVG